MIVAQACHDIAMNAAGMGFSSGVALGGFFVGIAAIAINFLRFRAP